MKFFTLTRDYRESIKTNICLGHLSLDDDEFFETKSIKIDKSYDILSTSILTLRH